MVFDVSLEMQSDSKNYVRLQDDEITELVHMAKCPAVGLMVLNGLNARQSEIFRVSAERFFQTS